MQRIQYRISRKIRRRSNVKWISVLVILLMMQFRVDANDENPDFKLDSNVIHATVDNGLLDISDKSFNDSSEVLKRTLMELAGIRKIDKAGFVGNSSPFATYSIFSTEAALGGKENDGNPIEVGMKFRVLTAGTITGIKYYKPLNATGTHLGKIWSSTGTQLGNVAFSGESASGWQTATFTTPISVSTGQTYVASYYSPSGDYNGTASYFGTAITVGTLKALAHNEDGSNGVYSYTTAVAGSVFPTGTTGGSNYWVDVVFVEGTGSDTQAPTVPAGLASSAITQTTFTLSWTASTDNVAVTGYEVFRNGTSIGTPTSNTFNVTGLAAGTNYSFTVRARDAVPNWSAQSSALSVTTSAGSDTQAPSVPSALTSSAITQTSFTLSWTASTDNIAVTGYEVFQNAVSIGTPTSNTFNIAALTAGTTYTFTVRARDAVPNWSAQSAGLSVTTSAAGGGSVSGTANYVAKFTSATAVGNSLLFDNGNFVGIKTSTPDQLLTINSATGVNSLVSFKQNGVTAGYVGLGIDGIYRNETVPGTNLQLRTVGANYISFATNVIERMRIEQNGNISIGATTDMGYKLNVNGTIASKKVKVFEGGWADFVFEKNYALPSLEFVDNFIKTNRHLPEIPSAEEIEKTGNDLGATQVLLLTKIEELTLYIIEQNKRLDMQEKKLEVQGKQIKKLENKR